MNRKLVEESLHLALRLGANDARVVLTQSQINSYTLLNGELEKLQHSLSRSLFFQLFIDGRYGTFSTNMLEIPLLEKHIREAIISTKLLAPDMCRTLPPKELYFQGEGADLKQCDLSYDTIGQEAKREILERVADEIDLGNSKVISVSNEYEDFKEESYTLDSQGFYGESSQTIFSLSTECSVKGEGDARPQNYWYDSSIHFHNLPSGCGKIALKRALSMIGAKRVRSGKYHVVIDRSVASKVFSPILSALSGGAIQQRKSFLLDSIGRGILGEKLTIKDTPHIVGLMGSRWHDSEGLATHTQDIVLNGAPQTYFLTTYYGNKLGVSPTIESISVPYIVPFGEEDAVNMMKSIGSGIYITGFNGGNCNGATGDFSFGIEGFVFKNGVISHPIKEMNMSGNIISLWEKVTNIGTDFRDCSRWRIPSLAFEDVDLSGQM